MAIKKIPLKSQVILLMHHPIDWLASQDSNLFSSFVEKYIDVILFGHMHEFRQIAEKSFEDITIRLQAGTIDTKNTYSGYSLISHS